MPFGSHVRYSSAGGGNPVTNTVRFCAGRANCPERICLTGFVIFLSAIVFTELYCSEVVLDPVRKTGSSTKRGER